MRRYKRVIVGKGSSFAAAALSEGWVGSAWLLDEDLTGRLPETAKEFRNEFIPKVMEQHGMASKVGAGLACGMTWVLARALNQGDIVITPDTDGALHVGEISGPYEFKPGTPVPHRRPVNWLGVTFRKEEVSEEFQRTLSSGSLLLELGSQAQEIENMLSGRKQEVVVRDATVESALSFVLERHLEDFLVSNWQHTELGRQYDLFAQDGEAVGRQFETDTGPIDILAQSKDGTELVVVELKRGRVSDVVVGQILRYMSFIRELDESKTVKGIIVGTDDDPKFRRALSMVPSVEFYRYEVSFTLSKT